MDKKIDRKFNIATFFIALITFVLIWAKEGGIISLLTNFDVNAPDLGGRGVEIRKGFIRSTFNPFLSQLLVLQFTSLFFIMLVFTVTLRHIYLKRRYYVYLVGRGKDFFRIYLIDGLKKIITSTAITHAAFVVFLFSCYFAHGNWDRHGDLTIIAEFQTLGFIKTIFINFPPLVYLVLYWIPVYIFTIIAYLIIIVFNELFKNNIITLGAVIAYLYLGSFVFSYLGKGHWSMLLLVFTAVEVYVPYQYILSSSILSIVLLMLLYSYRKVYKIDEI